MSTREDVKTFFGLPLDFSMLELEPETGADPVRYFCTPENAEIIGWGSCGTHFVLLPGDEAVYCVEPELAEEGCKLWRIHSTVKTLRYRRSWIQQPYNKASLIV